MTRIIAVTTVLVALTLAVPVQAEEVTVKYMGVNTYGTTHVYRDGHYLGHFYAAQMSVKLDGVLNNAYCVDLDHTIHSGQTWLAQVYPAPRTPEYCQMAQIANDYDPINKWWGSVIQVAFWKLAYPGHTVYVSESSIEAGANDLLADTEGTCPVSCEGDVALDVDVWADMYGTIHVSATLTEEGEPAPGQPLELTVDGGTIIEADAVTDEFGVVYGTLEADALPVTVTAEATSRWIYAIDPIGNAAQELQTLTYGEPCWYAASDTFDASPMGDPRTIGFWKHQAKVATGGKGRAHVPADMLESWLPIEVFDLTVDSLEGLYDALWIKKAPMQVRAQQQCLATMLNVAYGQLAWYTEVDVDEDGFIDGWFYELFLDAYDAYAAGDFEGAKTICDDINNL